jgi:hypothetical protein
MFVFREHLQSSANIAIAELIQSSFCNYGPFLKATAMILKVTIGILIRGMLAFTTRIDTATGSVPISVTYWIPAVCHNNDVHSHVQGLCI